jgi:Salmonella virulence plasmid 65kDa B protein/Insecticide toxin TcdB middle/N-terminal region/FG-GAP-like repeat
MKHISILLLVVLSLLMVDYGSAQSLSLPQGTIVSTETSNNVAVAAIVGSAGVTRTGAVEYRIPLWSAPGRAGIEPKLELAYNSESGDGIVGLGWSLVGLSTVTRCSRTLAQDGVASAVTFTDGSAGDRFCLNGSRLVLVAGTAGTTGAEYRLESQLQTKLVILNADTRGPFIFKEYEKDGTIVTYGDAGAGAGATTEGFRFPISRFHWGFNIVRSAWHMVRIEDRYGNYLRISYTHADVDSAYEVYPHSIEYTGYDSPTASLSPDRIVQFNYEPRPDVSEFYIAGFHNKRTVRLVSLSMIEGVKTWKQYNLHYIVSPSTRRSLLRSIEECDADGTCTSPTQFDWTSGQNLFVKVNGGSLTASWGDLNGDGKGDLLNRDSNGFYAQLSNGTGLGDQIRLTLPNLSRLVCPDGDPFHTYPQFAPASSNALVDVDGDGKADFVGAQYKLTVSTDQVTGATSCSVSRSIEVYRNTTPPNSNALSFSLSYSEPYTYVNAGDEPRYADMDGDGLPEMIADSHGFGYGVKRNLGHGQFGPYITFPASVPQWSKTVGGLIISSDDTGRAQVLMRAAGTDLWQASATPTTTSFLRTSLSVDTTACSYYGDRCGNYGSYYMADVNGDGLTDAIMFQSAKQGNDGSVNVSINTGNGFAPPVLWSVDAGPSHSTLLEQYFTTVSDYDGDGKDDLIARSAATCSPAGCPFSTVFWLLRPGAPGEFLSADLVGTPGDRSVGGGAAFDFNGDGLLDYFLAGDDTTEEGIYIRAGMKPDLLHTITDGFGAFDHFLYKPSGDTSVYSVGSDEPQYPLSPAIAGRWLVSSWTIGEGLKAERTRSYTYSKSRLDLKGRGWLGFGNVTTVDSATGMAVSTDYDIETNVGGNYPGADLIAHEITTWRTQHNIVTAEATNTYQYSEDLGLTMMDGIAQSSDAGPSLVSASQQATGDNGSTYSMGVETSIPVYGEGNWGTRPATHASSQINDGGLRSAALWCADRTVKGIKVILGARRAFLEIGASMGSGLGPDGGTIYGSVQRAFDADSRFKSAE